MSERLAPLGDPNYSIDRAEITGTETSEVVVIVMDRKTASAILHRAGYIPWDGLWYRSRRADAVSRADAVCEILRDAGRVKR